MAEPVLQFAGDQLLLSDFDDTIAITSELSKNQVTVASAYEESVLELFGASALMRYRVEGGLKNRSPSEVVAQLAPDNDPVDQNQRTEDLVRLKIGKLTSQIGSELPDGNFWPRLSPGFKAVWSQIAELPSINTGIVSSGHRLFIEKVYELHELAAPDLMLTDDEMQRIRVSESMSREATVKPSPFLLFRTHYDWMEHHVNSAAMSATPLTELHKQVTYVGDDPIEDGRMAQNYGVSFMHIDASTADSWHAVGHLFLPENYVQRAA